jgi:hypothetical protein
MATFALKEVQAVGTASIQADGSLTQSCMVITEIQGIKAQGKVLSDLASFEIPNSVMANQAEPLKAAWVYISDVLAPQFVADTYGDI